MGEPESSHRPETPDTPEGLRCDFCGATVPRVRRVALDGDYERLRTPHRPLYACPECSERKESARRGKG
jgi:hypothetical protein